MEFKQNRLEVSINVFGVSSLVRTLQWSPTRVPRVQVQTRHRTRATYLLDPWAIQKQGSNLIHSQPTVFFGITLNPSRVSRILRRKLIDLLTCWTNHLHQGPFTYWPQEELNTATCPDNHTQAAESYRVGLFWSVISQFVVPKSVKLRKTSTFVPFLRFDPRTKSSPSVRPLFLLSFTFLLSTLFNIFRDEIIPGGCHASRHRRLRACHVVRATACHVWWCGCATVLQRWAPRTAASSTATSLWMRGRCTSRMQK